MMFAVMLLPILLATAAGFDARHKLPRDQVSKHVTRQEIQETMLPELQKNIRKKFESEWDKDGDGCVTLAKLKEVYAKYSYYNERDLAKMYRKMDPDGDNCVTADDLVNAVLSQIAARKKVTA